MVSDFGRKALPILGTCLIFVVVFFIQASNTNNERLVYTIVGLISLAMATYFTMPTVSKVAMAGSLVVSIYFVWLLLMR